MRTNEYNALLFLVNVKISPGNCSCVALSSAVHGCTSAARGRMPEAAAIHGGRLLSK